MSCSEFIAVRVRDFVGLYWLGSRAKTRRVAFKDDPLGPFGVSQKAWGGFVTDLFAPWRGFSWNWWVLSWNWWVLAVPPLSPRNPAHYSHSIVSV
jgi:hypothetical protein